MRLANADTRDNVKSSHAQSGGDVWRKVETFDELTRLEQALAAPEQAGARIQGEPERPAFQIDLVLMLNEVDFGKLANGNVVMGDGALKVDVALGHQIDSKIGPMLGDETHRMCLRKDGLIKRFRELLAEGERSNIIELAARHPAVPQFTVEMSHYQCPAGGGLDRTTVM